MQSVSTICTFETHPDGPLIHLPSARYLHHQLNLNIPVLALPPSTQIWPRRYFFRLRFYVRLPSTSGKGRPSSTPRYPAYQYLEVQCQKRLSHLVHHPPAFLCSVPDVFVRLFQIESRRRRQRQRQRHTSNFLIHVRALTPTLSKRRRNPGVRFQSSQAQTGNHPRSVSQVWLFVQSPIEGGDAHLRSRPDESFPTIRILEAVPGGPAQELEIPTYNREVI